MATTIPPSSTSDPRAWTAAAVPHGWYRPLPDDLIAVLRELVRSASPEQPIEQLKLNDQWRARCRESFAPARYDLEHGRGFVILNRLPVEQLSQREATAIYWLLGQGLGAPFVQNVQGTLLYDVRDTGQDVASGARFSVTSYESSFHTDNSFGDSVLDYVGLLCLQTAKSGGVSQNVSGYTAVRVLQQEAPDVLEVLSQPFHVDRRGGTRAGESPTVPRPVIAWQSGELLVRYLRYWIEVGHDKAGEPLTAEQRCALDVFDAILARPELRVEFALQPGQAYFINNRWILHNRTAFTDHPELERRRHLVRLWLSAEAVHVQPG